MRTIALVGGGRWSRVLLSVLSEVPDVAQVLWITHYGYEAAVDWVAQHGMQSVRVLRSLDSLEEADAALVANSPHSHFPSVNALLDRGIPCLCEKPLVMETNEARQLLQRSIETETLVGVDLELSRASYALDFAALATSLPIHTIDMIWHDPWLEDRYGERKSPSVHTTFAHDILPHVWSLLRLLLPHESARVCDVDYRPDATRMFYRHRDAEINVSVSRRSVNRKRRIVINQGEAELDYSPEPGRTTYRGRTTDNRWRDPRPLAAVIHEFLAELDSPSDATDWDLAIQNCIESVDFAVSANRRLVEDQQACWDAIRIQGFDPKDPHQLAVAVDLLGPRAAAIGHYLPLVDPRDQRESVCQWVSLLDQSSDIEG
ncbi:hypothetical protein FYK55_15240 [Roseiconus nitratireducens]|uniref:Gfo/Idh/MocA-like oxidoreductase N-terminal domain-containing protein n=1 Tax=Roseiconus nitratireducens TaxID=2605748 RepID=A0A5M6D7A8_9BACT|nr:Gfo/Idh/MocA family oxidoreductase [Roseiconus nitratireducens]KAA5542162.1 hypothetical protein FYK55_15240 [Roseiconus nitratireducens]